jgi:hypothetical protein
LHYRRRILPNYSIIAASSLAMVAGYIFWARKSMAANTTL